MTGLEKVTSIAKTYGPKGVDHVLVYVTEAHPTDGWMAEVSLYDGITYATSIEERLAAARMFASDTKLRNGATVAVNASLAEAKVLVDNMEDTLERSYEARPERLYVVKDGKVLWRCGLGPFEFDPAGLESFLKDYLQAA